MPVALTAGSQSSHLYVTPWKDQCELLDVRNYIFGGGLTPPSSESRQRAVDQIRAWQSKKRLYLSIESTANIVEAQIYLEHSSVTPNASSSFVNRAALGTALSRYDPELCKGHGSLENLTALKIRCRIL